MPAIPTRPSASGRKELDRDPDTVRRILGESGRIRRLEGIRGADGPKPVPESAWITIAEAGADDWANWSPDGKTMYFTSRRDGQTVCGGSGSRQARAGWRASPSRCNIFTDACPFSSKEVGRRPAAESGLVLVEDTANIWIMSRSGAR
jgi:hypothetical protein